MVSRTYLFQRVPDFSKSIPRFQSHSTSSLQCSKPTPSFVSRHHHNRIHQAANQIRPLSHFGKMTSSSSQPPYNKLTYYTFGTPNGLKPAIVLEELNLKYTPVTVDISKNAQKEDWFLELNPNGRIPALKDGDLRVFESGAIMLYLTDQYDTERKISYPPGTPEHYEMLSWLMFQMGGLGPMQGQATHFRAMAPVRSDYGIKRYTDETKRLFSALESRLSKAEWLAGDKYTIADIANYSWVRAAPMFLGIELNGWPGLVAWAKRIEGRPAVEKAKNVPASTRTEEEMIEMARGMREKIDGMGNTDKH